MPEYLSPGVYLEEVSYRSKTIEGVSTSTTGFVGPALYGPTDDVPELLTSMADFERIYGSIEQLDYGGSLMHNYLAHAVRAYFENGGKRLYVSRVYRPRSGSDGHAEASISAGSLVNTIKLRARYPGAAGNMVVTFTFRTGPNILSSDNNYPVLRGASEYDLIWVRDLSNPIESFPGEGRLYWLERYFDEGNNRYSFKLYRPDPLSQPGRHEELPLANLTPDIDEVHIVTINATVEPPGKFARPIPYENLSFHPKHSRALGKIFTANPTDRSTALYVPIIFESGVDNGVDIAEILLDQKNFKGINITNTLNIENGSDAERTFQVLLKNGNDGERPGAAEYEGKDGLSDGIKSGLKALEDIEDISILAAPGCSYGYKEDYKEATETIISQLIAHCERMRYRIAVIDSGDGQIISEILRYRGKLDSKHAALYYPWVTILDPATGEEINLPPSGFVTGIYARNDEIGVHKAPANEVVNLAIGFELQLNKAQQEVLNPNAINCFRFFEGRGYRLWGARLLSSDPEWKYVNLRRHMAYLERSIEKATQWAVFEVNNERLWAKIRSTVEDFLYNEWTSNHLMGESPKEAYFVRCDRSTMTQNDLDNGRLICLVGVALVRPAEFVIFRIGQWTADRRT